MERIKGELGVLSHSCTVFKKQIFFVTKVIKDSLRDPMYIS